MADEIVFTHCVKCSAPKDGGNECPRCGVIYDKAERKHREEQQRIDSAVEELIAPIEEPENNNKLTNCPACEKTISKKAEDCPHCGEPLIKKEKVSQTKIEKKSIGCLGAIFLIGFLVFIANMFGTSPSSKSTTNASKAMEKKIKTPEELRKEELAKCFSGWNGSHRETEALIKRVMNDPDSYKHDETKYFDMKDHLVVITSYRGKNKFGGVVRNWLKVKTDITTCEVLKVIEEGQ
ncbi:MAG: hypothetical protein ACOYB1_18590 [Limnohabitans sp.]